MKYLVVAVLALLVVPNSTTVLISAPLSTVKPATAATAQPTTPKPTDPPICKTTINKYEDVQKVLEQCHDVTLGSFVVPAGQTLLLQPLDDTTITVTGKIGFEHHDWLGPLVQINATRLHMRGTDESVFNGNGSTYWDGKGEWGSAKPDFFFITAFDSLLEYLNIINTPKYFTQLNDSNNVTMSHFYLNNLVADKDWAQPYKSGGNSDGFNVWNSTNVVIRNSEIFNQDDCIALRCGENITVYNLFCHGGQGFSMSIGWSNDTEAFNTLKNVIVRDSSFVKGHNAVHIKTHINAGKGLLENITYENIYFEVGNHGIIIQQNFANLPKGSHQPKTAIGNIPIKHLRLKNVKGRVTNDTQGIPVYILCADGACQDWVWTDVNVTGTGDPHWHDKCNYKPDGFNCTYAQPSGASSHVASLGALLVAYLLKVLAF